MIFSMNFFFIPSKYSMVQVWPLATHHTNVWLLLLWSVVSCNQNLNSNIISNQKLYTHNWIILNGFTRIIRCQSFKWPCLCHYGEHFKSSQLWLCLTCVWQLIAKYRLILSHRIYRSSCDENVDQSEKRRKKCEQMLSWRPLFNFQSKCTRLMNKNTKL